MSDNERQLFQQIIATFDSPAYMRRSRDTEAAWNEIVLSCRRQYLSAAEIPLLRLVQFWHACKGNLQILAEITSNNQTERIIDDVQTMLTRWSETIQPMMIRADRNDAGSTVMAAWDTFVASCERFNRNWMIFVSNVDLAEVNRLRRDYNEYFLLEKECAVNSPLVARMGYEPLCPATHDDLRNEFPLLMPSVATPSELSGAAD